MDTYACVAPSKMLAPVRVTSTLVDLTLSWSEPLDDGGCPILGYAVFRNDGNNGAINIEVNTAMDTNIRDKPSQRSTLITSYPSNHIGKTFMYQIQVFNVVGSSLSQTASYKFAAVPPAPTQGPLDDLAVTSSA
jgi:hypothetical protein